MFFHYGNCKSEIQQHLDKIQLLENKVVSLLGEIHECKAMYDYQVGVLEKRVSDLQVETGARKCVCETMAAEVANLHSIISRKDEALKELSLEVKRLKSESEWKETERGRLIKDAVKEINDCYKGQEVAASNKPNRKKK